MRDFGPFPASLDSFGRGHLIEALPIMEVLRWNRRDTISRDFSGARSA
jgi:hypothetical protein